MNRTRTTRIAAAAGISLALALPASEAFAASKKTQNALIGGALGALAGALISDGDATATLGGAAAGALIGSATTNDRRYASRPAYQTRYRQPAYGYGRSYPVQGRYYSDGYRYDRQADYRYSGYGR